MFLAESDTGEYTAPLFQVVTITLLCSSLLALTMTPLLCVFFLKVKSVPSHDEYNSRFYVFYRNILLAMLRRPLASLAVVLVVFGIAMYGFQFVPTVFFPQSEKAIFTAEFELPTGVVDSA